MYLKGGGNTPVALKTIDLGSLPQRDQDLKESNRASGGSLSER